MPAKTKLYLVTGFLGSGKTTLLKRRLAVLDQKVGVLVNDFGKINFDSLAVGQAVNQVVELSNGSIFCSCLKEDFIEQLAALLRSDLDAVYIESSGLADPSEMGKILQLVKSQTPDCDFIYRGSICMIDARYFLMTLDKMVSVSRQVRHSHLLVVNKTDLVDDRNIQAIQEKLAELNPAAQIILSSYGDLNWDALPAEAWPIEDETSTNKASNRNKNLLLRLVQPASLAQFKAFMTDLDDYFYRTKGYACLDNTWYKIDVVNQLVSIQPSDPVKLPDGYGDLVFLASRGLDSISHLAKTADQHLTGVFRLEV